MNLNDRIESFVKLGQWLRVSLIEIENARLNDKVGQEKTNELASIIEQAGIENAWFTKDSVIKSLDSIVDWLDVETLKKWTASYYLSQQNNSKKVAVIMAGNIPLVNFHDFLCVLITGNQFLGKLSSQDKLLLPFLANKLIQLNAAWKRMIDFTEERLDIFDAVIATGSNNSSRYFEYYFGKYPHIIRKNRNSIAVLSGNESDEDLIALYNDIFEYYGMGCRNVSMLLVPKNYDFPAIFGKWEGLQLPTAHYKYNNNYDYYRSFYLVNRQPFFDTGYASILKNDSIASPISVIHYKEYNDVEEVRLFLESYSSQIQCIVSTKSIDKFNITKPGAAQCPTIIDYPDGVDIVQFLLAL